VLTATIKDFGGSILLISHDQDFTEEIGIATTIHLA